jgi:hypothetical protein
MADERHTIEIDYDDDNDRAYWWCDCGAAGNCASDRAELAAERHIPADVIAVYRSRGGAR